MTGAVRLSIELEAALLRELRRTYGQLAASHFRGKLRSATLELTGHAGRLGRWVPEVRTIEVSRSLVLEEPWSSVVEVLKHEMAHQYVHEVLGVHDETSHGPAFRDVCERLAIDARASGLPSSSAGRDEREERVLSRVAKLLALAESPNANEAQSAMNAAQRLVLKHNLEGIGAPSAHERHYVFRHLGTPSGRVNESERLVGAILGRHFFVEAIWVPVWRPLEGRRGSVLEICGTHDNVEMAAYVHSFLTHTAEQLWEAHKRHNAIRGDRERRTFLSGVMTGFLEKLDAQQHASRAEGLVWVGDVELHRYYRKRHPHVTTVRHAGPRRTAAHAHGREAGRNLVLHRPVGGGSGGSTGPRLLPK